LASPIRVLFLAVPYTDLIDHWKFSELHIAIAPCRVIPAAVEQLPSSSAAPA